jgi:hypothetical protein
LRWFCLIGDREDLFCHDLGEGLRKKGHSALWNDQFLNGVAELEWRLDSVRSSSSIWLGNQTRISESDIAGVVLRQPLAALGSLGATESATYSGAEQAVALLSWIWSLRCPVINRYRPELWFEPTKSLDFWLGKLGRFGLEAHVSDESRAPHAGSEAGEEQVRYYLCAVIGSRIIWDQGTPERLGSINDSLVEFTKSLDLTYLECSALDFSGMTRIASVEPFPKYDQFCLKSRQEIISELVKLLTGSEDQIANRTGFDSWF